MQLQLPHEFPAAAEKQASGRATSRSPQAPGRAGAPQEAGAGQSPAPALDSGSALNTITRVFRAEMRKSDDQDAVIQRIRRVAGLCAQFGNEILTANYLLYRHNKETDARLAAVLLEEAVAGEGRYKAWGDRLSSYTRDAITRRVAGLVKSKGREVIRGESSLPTFLRRGAILVRERGFKLWRDDDKRLLCSLKVEPDADPVTIQLWVKNLRPYYTGVLDKLLDGSYKITQAQVLIARNFKVSVRISYSADIEPATGDREARIVSEDSALALAVGTRTFSFGFDVAEASRRKHAIECRRVQCWRVLRGRRVKKRRARIYRSGTLSKLSSAWNDYQRTWSQQLAAVIVDRAVREKCSSIVVPSPQTLGEYFVSELDWTLVHNSLVSRAERAGLKITQIRTENEQKRDLRKIARDQARQAAKNQQNTEPPQPGVE